MKCKRIFLLAFAILPVTFLFAQEIISEKKSANSFVLTNAAIYVDANDFILVKKSAEILQADIEKVTGVKPALINSLSRSYKNIIAVGSLEKSLYNKTNSNPKYLTGKWEAYQIEAKSITGQNILFITGSDRRGTAYGVFELSKQMGVSPWYWWADVPVKKRTALYIQKGLSINDAPKVKYRGFFINDEAPALSGWSKEKFGGFNHQFYEKVFELLLRLKANYLWPAMWGNAFNDDDTLNPIKADEWGIVMGTSHHEPMLRAQQEWKRYGAGKWDYDSNEVKLKSFWEKGIENMGSHESIVTVGMRGDGDKPMTEGTATALLERIVKDQRQIIEDVSHKPASETPQLWALYKEVQDYYDKGMRVPDDVTLLLCDDNWGNIRKLPKPDATPRKGGYGIYYHFDYVGGPRNYKWLNTNAIPRVWEQMHLAYEYGVKNIWIVNVGDIKPMEFPLSFFLDYAWNPDKIGAGDLAAYTEKWAAQNFGEKYAKEIAGIISEYSKYNNRRKPEMLDANTYSFNYNEWQNVTNDYNTLLKKAEAINQLLPAEYKDAYFQLVLHPVKACANLNEMYYNAALNKQAYTNKWETANQYADKVKELYANDSLVTLEYHQLNNGKWDHIMDQKHIGYYSWQEPRMQRMPPVKYVSKDSTIAEVDSASKRTVASYPKNVSAHSFYELNAYVSIAADHFTKSRNGNGNTWTIVPDLGRTGSAITTFPVKVKDQQPGSNSPQVQYEFYTYSKGDFNIAAYFSPTLNFLNTENGLKYAISVDNETPQIISVNKEEKGNEGGIVYKWVGDNIIIRNTKHNISQPGKHILKYWMVSPAVVLQKMVVDFGGAKPSYLGPPETIIK
ncbi:MAG: glycosyl hydrolase 115 family protein [Ferruginibacter sp.]